MSKRVVHKFFLFRNSSWRYLYYNKFMGPKGMASYRWSKVTCKRCLKRRVGK